MKRIYYLIIALVIIFGLTVTTYAIQMTVGAIEDSGQIPGQGAYLTLAYASGPHGITIQEVPNPWTSSFQASSYASGIVPQGESWQFESGGNIWSSDLIVGDSLTNLKAGVYRVSVVSGAFTYDSFDWSNYKEWWWQLHVQSSMLPASLILGDTNSFGSEASALANSLGRYLDIPVDEGGSLIFWIWDWNSIDNFGSLTFNVTPIPEPATMLLIGSGLIGLAGYGRKKFFKK